MGIIETVSSVLMLISVLLVSFNKISNYPIGIVGCLGFAYLFFQTALFGNFILQFIFIIISIYGWYNWNKQKDDLKITWSKPKTRNILLIGGVILMFGIKLLSPLSLIDIGVTIFSLIATYLISLRNIDTWILWIIVDIASIYLY